MEGKKWQVPDCVSRALERQVRTHESWNAWQDHLGFLLCATQIRNNAATEGNGKNKKRR